MIWCKGMPLGYLLILLCCVFMCGMAVSRKAYQRRVDSTLVTTVTFMGVYSLSVCLIGAVYGSMTGFAMLRQMDSLVLGLSLSFSVILTVNTCLCIFGAKYGSLAIVISFANLGTLVISTVYGLISDPERNRLNGCKCIGMVLVLVILIIGFLEERRAHRAGSGNARTKADKGGYAFLGICLLIFLFNGSALPIYSAFSTYRGSFGGFNFIFVYLFFCTVLCGLVLAAVGLLRRKRGGILPEIRACLSLRPLLYTLLYGGLFLFSEYCSILAAGVLPIVVQAPLCFAVEVILVAVADYVLYRQRITKAQYLQIGLAMAGGVLFAL